MNTSINANTRSAYVGLGRSMPGAIADTSAAVRELARALLRDQDFGVLHAPGGEKPALLDGAGRACGFVSLTHTRDVVAAAISAGPIGVDVECLDRRVRWHRLAQLHYNSVEREWLEQQPEEDRKAAFLKLWTLKEAWLKAQGLGVWNLSQARFARGEDGAWRLPGDGWRGQCCQPGANLLISAVWQGTETIAWREHTQDGWAALYAYPELNLQPRD